MDKPYTINTLCGRKALISPKYHYWHNRDTGYFVRWGKSMMENPTHCPFGCEVVHMEVSKDGAVMPIETFKTIFGKLPDTLAIMNLYGCEHNVNKDEMLKVCTDNGVVPHLGVLPIADKDEGGLFSIYCNVQGAFFPSASCVGQQGWEHGLVLQDDSTFEKVWQNKRVVGWRMERTKKQNKTLIF